MARMKIFGFAGWSGSGKTTLIEQLIPRIVMRGLRCEPEPSLEDQIERISPCDLLLVEGHKHHPLPKLEVWRSENGKPLLHPEDGHIVAIASDTALETKLPRFDLNDHEGIGDFILGYNGFR